MRRALPGLELRVHRRVARLSAEAWRFHRVQAAVPGQQNDDDVDRGESRDEEGCSSDRSRDENRRRAIRKPPSDREAVFVARATCPPG